MPTADWAPKGMVELHPSFIEKSGGPEFVVLSVEEYESLRNHLEDLEDLWDLQKAVILFQTRQNYGEMK